jgi:purine-binding chemotaxis protein CheW
MLTQTSTDSIQVVSFNIINSAGKKEDYAMPIEQVREIRAVEKITKVPRSEPFVLGIMNLRGLIIPVIDVKKKLGLDSQNNSNSKQRILVADINSSLTGLLVDEVDQVIKIPTQEIEQPPQGTFDSYHYVKGIAKVNEKLVILLDVESLLGQRQAEPQKPKTVPVQNTPTKEPTKEPTEDLDNPTIRSLDDIPPELAEVFKEDEQGIPPTQIIRE